MKRSRPNIPTFIRWRRSRPRWSGSQAEIDAAGRGDKAALKAKLAKPKAEYEDARKQADRRASRSATKQVNKAVKELKKLQEERDTREQEIKLAAEREIAHLHEAAADLRRILQRPG